MGVGEIEPDIMGCDHWVIDHGFSKFGGTFYTAGDDRVWVNRAIAVKPSRRPGRGLQWSGCPVAVVTWRRSEPDKLARESYDRENSEPVEANPPVTTTP